MKNIKTLVETALAGAMKLSSSIGESLPFMSGLVVR